MPELKLLQLSDVHFGAPMTGGKLGLPDDRARTRIQERRAAFSRALGLVGERGLDGVLIPGDLFDDESIDLDTLRFVAAALADVAPAPVFIAPGNHDPFGGASPYRADDQDGGFAWPSNVHVFAHEEFRSVPWPGREDVVVAGCGFLANASVQRRRLASRIERPEAPIEILLFHGSRDGEFLQSEKATHPFSADELLAQGFTWTALGHYHGFSKIDDPEGRPRAAYSGCLTAGGLDEDGEKGCLVVTLADDRTEVEFVRLDPRRAHRLEVDLTGAGYREEAEGRIREALARTGVTADDLVHLRLTGRRAQGLELDFFDALEKEFFHLKIDGSGLAADIDLDRYPRLEDARTTEERFVAHLRARLGDADGDVVHRALLYGLDALHRQRLDTRYEE